jgi:threonine synthase
LRLWKSPFANFALSNGPTLAFKDMAMQLLGNLFEYVLDKRGEDHQHPRRHFGRHRLGGRIRDARQAQRQGLHALAGWQDESPSSAPRCTRCRMPNIFNIAVRGMFDDAQDIVKAVSNDAAFKAKYKIGAVNSINWARVAWRRSSTTSRAISRRPKSNDEQVAFAVPSGNFGNICAGHIARMMGLPIAKPGAGDQRERRARRVLSHRRLSPAQHGETHITSSPSMDISKASNFERFIFDLVGRDAAKVRELWAQVDAGGAFDLRGTPYLAALPGYRFVSGSSSHADRLATIRAMWDRHRVMIDTHTADGIKVASEFREPGVPMVVLETAQAVKFSETIREALGREPVRPRELEGIESLPQRVDVVDASVEQVKAIVVRNC